jgi:rhodanese-related sulfurtransferase
MKRKRHKSSLQVNQVKIAITWEQENANYQIIDTRSPDDYEVGHIPHAINIPWQFIAKAESLGKIDPQRKVITYSENGQIGQLASTALGLLGYTAVNMKYGMMDWNKSSVDISDRFDTTLNYPVMKDIQD